jgi:acyl-CoA carboxylase epsilon subunit
VRVVRGEPTAAELAALTVVLSKLQTRSLLNANAAHSAQPARGAGWRDRGALIGAPLQPGPGAWRRSGLPR